MVKQSTHATPFMIGIDRTHPLSLQDQIRQKIIDSIAIGTLTPGQRLPSSRQLSAELGVARNTIAAAYERLIADGHLVSRDRSGVFVCDNPAVFSQFGPMVSGPGERPEAPQWRKRLPSPENGTNSRPLPPDWEMYPFPFIDGPLDKSVFPVAEWREASRRALSVSQIESWIHDSGDADDPMLVDEFRTKVLPRRGIQARPEEILITLGAQQALHLAIELFVRPGTLVAVEEPCDPDLRFLLKNRGARLQYFNVDEKGLIPDGARLAKCEIIFVSPSHQRPTGASLSDERRQKLLDIAAEHGQVIVEDDYQWEAGFASSGPAALRGTPSGENVVYAATLAQMLAPALRLGVLVADAPVIRAARAIRRITTRHPALSVQRTAAHLLALGHYSKVLNKIEQIFSDRMVALRDALNHYLPLQVSIMSAASGTAAWITGPPALNARSLAKEAEAHGVLIEPAQPYFAKHGPGHIFRLGVTGIQKNRIREGIAVLAQALRQTMDPSAFGPRLDPGAALSGAALKRVCSGATLLCKTVYGDPCTILLKREGSMSGRAGFANEESDIGKWWVEDDLWCRQWSDWAYGEIAKFQTVVKGDRIQWFNEEGRLIDAAVIVRASDVKTSPRAMS